MLKTIWKLILVIAVYLNGQTIQINEVVSSNQSSFFDEDGDTPDWIELYNPSNQAVNLDGFGITDDPGDLSMWIFPSIVIEPNGFLVIFASDLANLSSNEVRKQAIFCCSGSDGRLTLIFPISLSDKNG